MILTLAPCAQTLSWLIIDMPTLGSGVLTRVFLIPFLYLLFFGVMGCQIMFRLDQKHMCHFYELRFTRSLPWRLRKLWAGLTVYLASLAYKLYVFKHLPNSETHRSALRCLAIHQKLLFQAPYFVHISTPWVYIILYMSLYYLQLFQLSNTLIEIPQSFLLLRGPPLGTFVWVSCLLCRTPCFCLLVCLALRMSLCVVCHLCVFSTVTAQHCYFL